MIMMLMGHVPAVASPRVPNKVPVPYTPECARNCSVHNNENAVESKFKELEL